VAALPDARQALALGRLSKAEFDYIRAGGAEDEDTHGAGSLGGIGYLLRRRKTWGLATRLRSYTYAYYVLLTWLPGYLEKQFGVKLLAGGLYTMIPWLVAVAAQFLIGGLVMDTFIARRRGPDAGAADRAGGEHAGLARRGRRRVCHVGTRRAALPVHRRGRAGGVRAGRVEHRGADRAGRLHRNTRQAWSTSSPTCSALPHDRHGRGRAI